MPVSEQDRVSGSTEVVFGLDRVMCYRHGVLSYLGKGS